MENETKSVSETKNTRILVIFEDARVLGHATAHVGPRQSVVVISPNPDGTESYGGKCEHGVYIPHNVSGDRAPYCSNCHPFEIVVKKNSTFKA